MMTNILTLAQTQQVISRDNDDQEALWGSGDPASLWSELFNSLIGEFATGNHLSTGMQLGLPQRAHCFIKTIQLGCVCHSLTLASSEVATRVEAARWLTELESLLSALHTRAGLRAHNRSKCTTWSQDLSWSNNAYTATYNVHLAGYGILTHTLTPKNCWEA